MADKTQVNSAAQMVHGHPRVTKLAWRMHKLIYSLTGGWLGRRVGKMPVLMLTTTGRKSGEPRSTILSYWRNGKSLVVVASNAGWEQDPAWWLNLQANPRAQVRVGRRKIPVVAEKASPEERDRLWARITSDEPQYAGYEKLTSRDIPVVIFKPVPRENGSS